VSLIFTILIADAQLANKYLHMVYFLDCSKANLSWKRMSITTYGPKLWWRLMDAIIKTTQHSLHPPNQGSRNAVSKLPASLQKPLTHRLVQFHVNILIPTMMSV